MQAFASLFTYSWQHFILFSKLYLYSIKLLNTKLIISLWKGFLDQAYHALDFKWNKIGFLNQASVWIVLIGNCFVHKFGTCVCVPTQGYK